MKHAAPQAVTTSRLVHYDVLRIVAVLAVVLLHIAAAPVLREPIGSSAWHVGNLYDSAVRFCVPVLVMLSGVFFLDPARPVSTTKLYTKYLLRIVVAYVAWTLAYVAHDVLLDLDEYTVREVVEKLVSAPGHLWFLFMIAGLYALVPLLRPIAASVSLTRYFVGLWVIFGLFGALVTTLPQPGWVPVQQGLSTLNMQMVVGYTGYFLLGSHLARHPLSRRNEMLVYLGGVVGFTTTVLATWQASESLGRFADQYYEYPTPNVALVAVTVFTFFTQRVSRIRFSPGAADVIVRVSAWTFGIYLVHMMFLKYFLREETFPLSTSPLWAVPAAAAVVFVLSLLVTVVLRRIPAYRRYLS